MVKRKSDFGAVRSAYDPNRTSAEGQTLALLALPESAFAARVSF